MVRVECESLTKEYVTGSRRIKAVDSVDLEIEEGTFVTILGPSGCGKTTLLRMLAGLETPTEGVIRFDGEDVTDQSVQERRIGMVFQNIALFPYKTVRQNIEYGLKYTDASKARREEAAEQMAEMLGIIELMDNKPNQLSGGQRQRVALGRALVRDPKVFLLDEPMSDLDAELKVSLRTELKELHKEFRTTTLYVTHDQEEAMTLSEEVIVLKDGEVQQQSPPFEMYDEPTNMFVAGFIGSPNINFFDARLDGEELIVSGIDRAIEVPPDTASAIEAQSSGGLTVGIRPSALRVVEDTADAMFEASTQLYEQLGDETILHLSVGELDVRATVPPEMTPAEGETVRFTFEPSAVHVFDSESGEAIANGLTRTGGVAGADEGESAI